MKENLDEVDRMNEEQTLKKLNKRRKELLEHPERGIKLEDL